MTLCLHSGGKLVNEATLDHVRTPASTSTWTPIPHIELFSQVRSALLASHLRVKLAEHALSHEGDRYFGLLTIGNGKPDSDHALMVGVRNSHDQTYPAGFLCGSRVFVCDNLSFSGEVRLARKHTRFIRRDLPGLVHKGVARLMDLRGLQTQRFAAYRNHPFTDSQTNDLLIAALDARIIGCTALPKVLDFWRAKLSSGNYKVRKDAAISDPCPEFWMDESGDFRIDRPEPTAWRLFNCFTCHFKLDLDTRTIPERTTKLHGLLDGACGLVLSATSQN